MYSTKTIHKNINPNYKASYTSIGDPYKSSIEKLPSRYRSKQFVTQRYPKNADAGFFTKLNYVEEEYNDNAEKYSETFPLDERKLGFGSRDAMKRGEFTSTKATDRFRETLKQEFKAMRSKDLAVADDTSKENASEQNVTPLRPEAPAEPKNREGETLRLPKFLYDIGRTQCTPFDPSHQKDRFYNIPHHAKVTEMKKSGGAEDIRRLGTHGPMSQSIGARAWAIKYSKPEFGRKK